MATVLSNTGTWMNDVGAAWLMKELASTPLMVAMIQSATTLPVLCFARIAGVLTDRLDHKRPMISINTAMAAVAGLMAGIVWFEAMTAPVLLTFPLNTGAAFLAPLWLASVPFLVARPALPAALALNSMGINISRAIGPSLAGLAIAAAGLWSPFALNALSLLGILIALLLWRLTPRQSAPGGPIRQDIAQIRIYLSETPEFRAMVVRAFGFFLAASAGWALLPVLARTTLAAGSAGFGLMMGAIGVGAVLAALPLPRLRRCFRPDILVADCCTLTGLCLFGLALASQLAVAMGIGMLWSAVLSAFHIATQTLLPAELRGGGSVFLIVFFGTMAAFALIWGAIATLTTPARALIAAVLLRGFSFPG